MELVEPIAPIEQEVKHFDIYHNCKAKLSFVNRLRILWNGNINMQSTIVVDKEVNIISSKAGIITNKIFYRKPKEIIETNK